MKYSQLFTYVLIYTAARLLYFSYQVKRSGRFYTLYYPHLINQPPLPCLVVLFFDQIAYNILYFYLYPQKIFLLQKFKKKIWIHIALNLSIIAVTGLPRFVWTQVRTAIQNAHNKSITFESFWETKAWEIHINAQNNEHCSITNHAGIVVLNTLDTITHETPHNVSNVVVVWADHLRNPQNPINQLYKAGPVVVHINPIDGWIAFRTTAYWAPLLLIIKRSIDKRAFRPDIEFTLTLHDDHTSSKTPNTHQHFTQHLVITTKDPRLFVYFTHTRIEFGLKSL